MPSKTRDIEKDQKRCFFRLLTALIYLFFLPFLYLETDVQNCERPCQSVAATTRDSGSFAVEGFFPTVFPSVLFSKGDVLNCERPCQFERLW